MTLGEFVDAVDGFDALEEERLKWQFFCTRKICYWVAATGGVKDITEEEILPIKELDEEIKRIRVHDLPIAKVITDGTE